MSRIEITSEISRSELVNIVADLNDLTKFILDVDSVVSDQDVTNEITASLLEISLKEYEKENAYYFDKEIWYTFEDDRTIIGPSYYTSKIAKVEKQIRILKLMLKLMDKLQNA